MPSIETEIYTPRTSDANGSNNGAETSSPGLFDLLLIAASHKWLIAGAGLAGGIAAAAISLILPPMYTSAAVIMPPQQQQSAASSLLGQLGPMASLAGRDLGFKTPADLYIGILSGRTIADRLIDSFELRKLYEVKTYQDARKTLAKRTHF